MLFDVVQGGREEGREEREREVRKNSRIRGGEKEVLEGRAGGRKGGDRKIARGSREKGSKRPKTAHV